MRLNAAQITVLIITLLLYVGFMAPATLDYPVITSHGPDKPEFQLRHRFEQMGISAGVLTAGAVLMHLLRRRRAGSEEP
jgi:hypothetical protein